MTKEKRKSFIYSSSESLDRVIDETADRDDWL